MLAHVQYGNGSEPVILLHGIPGSHRIWHRVAPLVGAHRRVFAPDLLGFGSSPDPQRDGHAEEQAEALLPFLQRTTGPAHVVGFDFGGPVAVHLYRRAPSLIRSLTLVASNVVTTNEVPFVLRTARVPLLGELVFALLCSERGLSMAFPGVASLPRERRTTRTIFLNSIRHLRRLYTPIEETLPSIRVPVTVVWGDRDPFFSVEAGRMTASRIPGARFVVLEGCGHLIPEERPEELADVILATR